MNKKDRETLALAKKQVNLFINLGVLINNSGDEELKNSFNAVNYATIAYNESMIEKLEDARKAIKTLERDVIANLPVVERKFP